MKNWGLLDSFFLGWDLSRIYTGLIVDARGIPVRASTSPRVVADDGREVFAAEHQELAAFYTTLEAAQADQDRLGKRPLILRAIAATQPDPTRVVILSRDATLVMAEDAKVGFLREFRVGIVSDRLC